MLDFKVYLGKVARTVIFEDPKGEVVFSFDFEETEENFGVKKTIVLLERQPNHEKQIEKIKDPTIKANEMERYRFAFEEIKKYMIACGHQVKIWPQNFEDKK